VIRLSVEQEKSFETPLKLSRAAQKMVTRRHHYPKGGITQQESPLWQRIAKLYYAEL